jgi:hypothetical protein
MNHPRDPQLMEFLYGEIDPAQRAEVLAHVSSCDECRRRVESWREVRGALQSWKLADVARPSARPRMMIGLRWALAASVLIAVGFGLARLTAPQQVASAPDPALVESLRAELKQDLSVQLAALHREYRTGMEKRIREIELARQADFEGLRQDVETVALRTQEEFARLATPVVDHSN